MIEVTEELRRIPLFQGMSDAALDAVADLVSSAVFETGHRLTVEGETGHEFYVLTEGNVSVARGGRPIRQLGPGDFIGEISLVDGRPRTATTTALDDVRVLVIQHQEFAELMDRYHAVRHGILMALTERIRQDERSIDA